MGTRPCEGYCGGRVAIRNIHYVGRAGERFCPECASERLRREYYEN